MRVYADTDARHRTYGCDAEVSAGAVATALGDRTSRCDGGRARRWSAMMPSECVQSEPTKAVPDPVIREALRLAASVQEPALALAELGQAGPALEGPLTVDRLVVLLRQDRQVDYHLGAHHLVAVGVAPACQVGPCSCACTRTGGGGGLRPCLAFFLDCNLPALCAVQI